MKFDSLLIDHPMMEKLSVAENPNGQQLEQDFGKLAYTFLKDRAPKLIPFLIGFETVEGNPDGSRSSGIFGFKVGQSIYYVPVFFINNQIRGMDSIYSRSSDTFVPLTETYISEIITKQNSDFGEAADASARESFSVPDFGVMASPPQLGAGGRDSGSIKASSVMKDLVQHFVKMAARTYEMFETDPPFKAMLVGAIAAEKGCAFEKTAAVDSELVRFVSDKGGPQYARALAQMLQNPVFAKAACSFYNFKDLLVKEFDESLKPKTAETKVTVVSRTDDCQPCSTSSSENGKKLLTQGFYIEDKRKDDEKTEAFDYKTEDKIYNPTEPGTYDVMMTGGISKCQVLMPSVPAFGNRMMLVVDKDGNSFTAHARRVFVNGDNCGPEETEKIFDSAKDPKDMEIGKKYVLIDANMRASVPFTVKSTVSAEGGVQRYVIDYNEEVKYDLNRDDAGNTQGDNCRELGGYPSTYNINLYLSPSKGQLKGTGESLLVPEETWKALELKSPEGYDARRALESAFRPASYTEVCEDMFKNGMHDLRLESRDEGIAYSLYLNNIEDSSNITFKNACVKLVTHYGLSVEDSEIMLKEARTKFKARRLIKTAQIPMNIVPPQIPPINQGGYDQQIGVPVQNPQVSYMQGETPAPTMRPSGAGSGINVGGEASQQQGQPPGNNSSAGNISPDMGSMDVNQLAQMAAQSGQQQVFDQSTIGGMARIYDTGNIIDSYIPEFLKSLDKLGRLIFLFYWKNDDWAERFGLEDMTGMEDKMRSVFKSFGDLVMKFKQKGTSPESQMVI